MKEVAGGVPATIAWVHPTSTLAHTLRWTVIIFLSKNKSCKVFGSPKIKNYENNKENIES